MGPTAGLAMNRIFEVLGENIEYRARGLRARARTMHDATWPVARVLQVRIQHIADAVCDYRS